MESSDFYTSTGSSMTCFVTLGKSLSLFGSGFLFSKVQVSEDTF